MAHVIVALVSFIAGALVMAFFGKSLYAKAHDQAIGEFHAIETRWARLITNLKASAHKTIDKV